MEEGGRRRGRKGKGERERERGEGGERKRESEKREREEREETGRQGGKEEVRVGKQVRENAQTFRDHLIFFTVW